MAGFGQIKFANSSVRSFSSSASWGLGGPSQLSVRLVDDPLAGDSFSPPLAGTPVLFECGSFQFWGLFQKFSTSRSPEGFPVYEAILTDPRELLEGTQVILAGYSGAVGGIPNLLNAFGFWEAEGYGLSFANDAGIPWFRVRDAINALVNGGGGVYGGPLTFQGYSYKIDLSQLPQPPEHYRMGGVSMSLLEIIAQICDDGGHDFLVELDYRTIRVRTVSRATQPPLGTITKLTSSYLGGSLVRSESGVEARVDQTSAFLVGGEVTYTHTTDSLLSYWGVDPDGVAIFGDPGYNLWKPKYLRDGKPPTAPPTGIIFSKGTPPDPPDLLWTYSRVSDDEYELFLLNASPIADILGSNRYLCSDLELRFAISGMFSWLVFMGEVKPEIAKATGLTSPLLTRVAHGIFHGRDAKNDKRGAISAIQTDLATKMLRFFEFVQAYAREFYGKKWAVPLPFLLYKVDPETLKLSTSYEVADAGYEPEGSSPLGLPTLYDDIFRSADGRVKPLAQFKELKAADFSTVNPQGSVIVKDLDSLYVEGQADPRIVFTPAPYAVLTLSSNLTDQPSTPDGDRAIIEATLQKTPEEAAKIYKWAAWGHVGLRVAPAARKPKNVLVPLRSTTSFYGPWYAKGVPGKTRFEQDPSLVPWNYGGFEVMDLAGFSRVTQGITNTTMHEAGVIEVTGTPSVNLGMVLQQGGPNVTGIDVRYDHTGVTTSYRFATFTPRFGIWSKGQTDRVKRLALAGAELRRNLRTLYRRGLADARQNVLAGRVRKNFLEDAPKPWKKESPLDVLIGQVEVDPSGWTRVGASLCEMYEAVAVQDVDGSGFHPHMAAMSLDGLVRPFSVVSGNAPMPWMRAPTMSGGLFSSLLNPWKAPNDIEVYLWASGYEGLNAFQATGTSPPWLTARPFALRGPLVLAGWGVDLDGNHVPGDSQDWASGYLLDYGKWAVGPVDHLWDSRRKVWTSHDIVRGRVLSTGTFTFNLDVYDGQDNISRGWSLPVRTVDYLPPTGAIVLASYSAPDNGWYGVGTQAFKPSVVASGWTGSVDYVSDVTCSGTTLLVTKKTAIYDDGRLRQLV